MDVGTLVDAGGDVKVRTLAAGAGVRGEGSDGRRGGPITEEKEAATHTEDEASSTETTGAKDAVERQMQTRDETRTQSEAA